MKNIENKRICFNINNSLKYIIYIFIFMNKSCINFIGLKTINAWKISIGNEKFLVSVAHNIIYKKNQSDTNWSWNKNLLSEYNSEWYFLDEYLSKPISNIKMDFAFKPISKYEKTITAELTSTDVIYDIKYYFYQPYDHIGQNICEHNPKAIPSLGCGYGCMYQHPGTEYFESVGMGWRGLSGALITNAETNNFLGLFSRRISYLGVNQTNISTDNYKVPRGFIIPTNVIYQMIYNSKLTKIK